jgi:hypothetical protein
MKPWAACFPSTIGSRDYGRSCRAFPQAQPTRTEHEPNRGYDEVMIVNPYDPRSGNQQIKLMRFHHTSLGLLRRTA